MRSNNILSQVFATFAKFLRKKSNLFRQLCTNCLLETLNWCCDITVDSATVTSQNELRSYKVSLHEKPNIIQNKTKNYIVSTGICDQKAEKQDLNMTYSIGKYRSVMQPLQHTPLCRCTSELIDTEATYYIINESLFIVAINTSAIQ